MQQWLRARRPWLGDVIAAAGGLALTLLGFGAAHLLGWRPWDPGSYVAIAVIAAAAWPLARLAPRVTLVAVAIVVSWPSWWYLEDPELLLLPLMLVAFRCALAGVRPALVAPVTAVAALMTLIPGGWMYLAWYVTAFFTDRAYPWFVIDDPSRRVLTAVVVAVVVVFGYLLRAQRSTAAQMRAKNAELTALRAADERRITQEVRTAIARDVHDVVAHHVSAMVIRAQAADRVADSHPEQLRAAVRAVAADGSEALAAMRRVVRVLRGSDDHDGHDGHDGEVPLVTAVDRLADRLRAGGLQVQVAVDAAHSPEFVQAALLRIIQEALTNVMLHATASNVSVQLGPVDGGLRLTVVDDGRQGSAPSSASRGGHGVLGMRERAEALQGTLWAGPREVGGWAVEAVVPLDRTAVAS